MQMSRAGADATHPHAGQAVTPSYAKANGWYTDLTLSIGAAAALIVAYQHGLPAHAVFSFLLMALVTGLGVSLGYHRLFAHHSLATFPPIECVLMVLGSMGGIAPFHWIAIHRLHHRHSDRDGDPHSPVVRAGRRLGLLRGFWHAHFGWYRSHGYGYPAAAVRDLSRRPDLVFIDAHWFLWCLAGLAIPALAGFLIGGTAYDALIAFLWGGMLRLFFVVQSTYAIGSLGHLWGSRPYATPDSSRNNVLLGVLVLSEGWHNNHHAFPYSARFGFHWWQADFTWSVIRLMELLGLAWRVRRPKAADIGREPRTRTPGCATDTQQPWTGVASRHAASHDG
jgi:stearoyl-CoA desaturase (delta-9 desaturase)